MIEAENWSPILENYKGLWIALSDKEKRVIASGKSLKDVISSVNESKEGSPRYFRVPKKITPYVGRVYSKI